MRGQQEIRLWAEKGAFGPRPETPEMPRPLTLGLQCREYQTLLVAGGLLEQPYRLWTYVQAALDAFDRRQLLQEQKAQAPKPKLIPGVGFE